MLQIKSESFSYCPGEAGSLFRQVYQYKNAKLDLEYHLKLFL